MSALRARDRLLLLLLVPLWLACFALFVHERASGRASRPALLVTGAAGTEGYPRVVRYRPGLAPPSDALRPGDEVLRIGGVDARGLSAVGVLAHSLAQADASGHFEVAFRRGRETRAMPIALLPEEWPWRTTAVALGFAATAVVLILRAPRSREAQMFLPAALVWSLCWIEFQGPHPAQTFAYVALRTAAGCFWPPLMLRAALGFPAELAARRTALWPWAFALLGPTWSSMWFGVPFPVAVGTRANPALGAAVIAALLFVLTRNYRRAGPAGRRKVKWVLLGIHLGTLPVLGAVVAAALDPDLVWLWNWSLSALVAIPISIFIAVTRSNLLDIDRLISTTATYTLLLTLLVAGALTALPRLAAALGDAAGVDADTVQVAFAIALAPVVVAVGRSFRPRVERLFFAERYALQAGVGELVRELGDAPDAADLVERAGTRLEELLRPASLALYGKAGAVYAPVFVRGARLAPTFAEASPLLAALAGTASLDLEDRRGRGVLAASAEDRGGVGSLGAVLLVPIGAGASRTGFVALGRKRSGDVYTSTDRALLAVVGAAVAAGLGRLGEKELLREARALQERLRRFVPGALASELTRGRALADGEREITVLFADLRSYASRSQERPPEEVFAAISRYAQLVSGAVVRNGGTVVEFAGDGVMAVFGAPDALAHKERAAVEAALAIAREVREREILPGAGGGPSVGVGVATGEAFVGTIHAVDRDLWSAIGNTTNRAARLQSLTRELGVWVALDEATWRAAGPAGASFERRPRVTLRGFRDPLDIFVC